MNRKYPGYFITLEGPEGSGKSSHMPQLVDILRMQGVKVFPTREPGGTSIGEQIREILHDTKNDEMGPRTETLLFQSARAQIVEQIIKPRLYAGEVVISDRFYDSTIAYQGYGHMQDLEQIKSLVAYAVGDLKPDLTFLLDVDIETGLKRKKSQNEWNRLDSYEIDFHRRVQEGYHKMVLEDIMRWTYIDANQTPEQVFERLRFVTEGRMILEGFIEGGRISKER